MSPHTTISGLNAYELGELDEALRWFRMARDQDENETDSKILGRRYFPHPRRAGDTRTNLKCAWPNARRKRDFTDFAIRAPNVGFGNDDNVFRSPNQSYIDLADPAAPLVTPVISSGAYIPLKLRAKYRVNALAFEGFYAAYKLSGRYYQDKLLENANEYQHEISFGSEYHRKDETRERKIHSAFTVAQHDETYFDRDDGDVRDVGGVQIGDRLNYLRYGPELTLRQSHEKLSVGAKIKGQLWNYEETIAAPEYDHEYFSLSLYGQYKFTPSSLLRITATGYSRRFGDRPAFDLDGQQRLGNPDIRYDYYALRLTTRERLFRSLWVGFDVERTERIDQYLGYNDYTRDSFSAEIHWSPGRRFDIEAKGTYRLYNYDNAFAFHNTTAGRKTQENAEGRIKASFRFTNHLSVTTEARYRETVSNDTRIQFERMQYHLGVLWEQ